jgi:integrase
MADVVGGKLNRLSQFAGDPGDEQLVFADPRTGGPLEHAAVLAPVSSRADGRAATASAPTTFGMRMAAANVPMRTLQEWMGHRDIETTQRYDDYAPSPHEAALVAAAFARDQRTGTQSVPAERIDP